MVGKVPRREGSGQHALAKSNYKVHNPQPAKKVKNLHAKQVSEKKATKHSTLERGSELSTEDLKTLASVKQSQHSRICFYPAA